MPSPSDAGVFVLTRDEALALWRHLRHDYVGANEHPVVYQLTVRLAAWLTEQGYDGP